MFFIAFYIALSSFQIGLYKFIFHFYQSYTFFFVHSPNVCKWLTLPLSLRSVHSWVLLKVLWGFRVYMKGDIWGVVERGWVWLGEDWSSSMEGVNTRVRGFFGWVETWMSWTITVIWRSSCGVILNHFTVEWVKILDCGAPPKVNHLDNPPRGIRMICLSCSH